ncbi:SPOR domain-containing protein [Bartonella sp. B10]
MSDNDRKDLQKIRQDHQPHDSVERIAQLLDANKQSKSQDTQSSLQINQSRHQPSETQFPDNDLDLSFLETEFESNLANDFPFDDKNKEDSLLSANNEQMSENIATTASLNRLEQSMFLSEKVDSPSVDLDEERILDALSPLPIQKNRTSQDEAMPTRVNQLFEKNNLDTQPKEFFFDKSDAQDDNTVEPFTQAKPFSQTEIPQSDAQNIEQNYYDNHQKFPNIPVNHSYRNPVNQENWQVDKSFSLKNLPQRDYATEYHKFCEKKILEQKINITQNPEYSDNFPQYIDNTEHISDQNNKKDTPYNQKKLDNTQTSSAIFNTTQVDDFSAYSYPHDNNPPPNVDTYKFTEEIVEKTEPIMVPKSSYESPEHDTFSDSPEAEFADVFNVGNVPVEDFSQRQQSAILNEIFNQTVQNQKDGSYVNTQKQNTGYYPADNGEYYSSSFAENSQNNDTNKILANEPVILSSKAFITRKIISKSVIPVILIAIGFISYFHFFTSSQKNENALIIRSDDTPFKFKQETTETENIVAHNLDVYKQSTENIEKNDDMQQFLINDSETPEDLEVLNQQEFENTSPPSFNESDVEEIVTEIASRTVPTKKVQTVIVKQDGTVTLTPMHHTDEKHAYDLEKDNQDTLNQFQEEAPISSTLSDTNNKEKEHHPTTDTVDIDKTITENASISNVEEKIRNSFIPVPVKNKFNTEKQTSVAASPSTQFNREATHSLENYYIQLSSQPTPELAKDSLKSIKSRFGFLIGTRPLNIHSAFITGKGTYYRVRIKARNRDEAINLCEEIKNFGGSCFITR